MEARIKLKPETQSQTSAIGKILMYMQDHPVATRRTNAKFLGKAVASEYDISPITGQAVIQKMVNKEMLIRTNGVRRCNFAINYMHRDIPGYILERASKETQQHVKEWKESIKSGQELAENGTIVTKADKKTDSELKNQSVPKAIPKEPENLSEEKSTSVPIQISDTERGLSISITLNLNINK